jgi:hypothetical protein
MLRFTPDDFWEGLLRPFLLADPTASLYAEIHAPDWRFAALALFLLIALASQRRLACFSGHQWRALAGLMLCFYVWTWVSGNGRYYLWGLVMVGPLVVMVAQRLPGSQGLRNLAVMGVLALQLGTLWAHFSPNVWGLQVWKAGPGWALEDSPLKAQPAVYLSVSTVSYSILVPQMHPDSRWASVAGQQDLVAGMPEHARLQALLNGPLPLYVVTHALPTSLGEDQKPTPQTRATIDTLLARQPLELASGACHFVRPRDAALQAGTSPVDAAGFLFCPLVHSQRPPPQDAAVDPTAEAVFEAVERRCPRFFPPGGTKSKLSADGWSRFYVYSDVGLYVTPAGQVYFKHFRALNATVLGPAERVREGTFELNCQRLPGRYAPPWARG